MNTLESNNTNINNNQHHIIKIDLDKWENDYHTITIQGEDSYISEDSTDRTLSTTSTISTLTNNCTNNNCKKITKNILFICLLFICVFCIPALDFYFAFFSNQTKECYNEIQSIPKISIRVWFIVQASLTLFKYFILLSLFLQNIQYNLKSLFIYVEYLKTLFKKHIGYNLLYFIIFMFSSLWTVFGFVLLSDTNNISLICNINIKGYLVTRVCMLIVIRMVELAFILDTICGCPI